MKISHNLPVFLLLCCLVTACDVTFKRKDSVNATPEKETTAKENKSTDTAAIKEADKSVDKKPQQEKNDNKKAASTSKEEKPENTKADSKENKSVNNENTVTTVQARRSKSNGITRVVKIIDNNQIKSGEEIVRPHFTPNDKRLVTLYYKDEGNSRVLNDMVKHTWINKSLMDELIKGNSVSAKIQVVPLPLDLERILSPVSHNEIRVQVGKKVILMNTSSRRIIDVIDL